MRIFFTTEELSVLAADIFTAGNLLNEAHENRNSFKTLWIGRWKTFGSFFLISFFTKKGKRKVKIGIECFRSYTA